MGMTMVEKRTFINKDKYEELMNLFKQKSNSIKKVNQVIYKYKSDLDFRLIFDSETAILRLRGIAGEDADKIVHINPKEVAILTPMLRHLGMYEEMKWYRVRTIISLGAYIITLDETYQYGYVASIAREVPVEQKEEETQRLNQLFEQLRIPITTAEQFNDRYKYYKMKWVDFARNIDEQAFISRN